MSEYGADEIMDCCGDYADECRCDEPFTLTDRKGPAVTILPVSYPCGHTVSVMAGQSLPANCGACAIGIPEGMTRCEDYPCCGHTDGDGCIPRPEHTSAYWSEMYSAMEARGMDDYEIDMAMSREDYGY